MIDNFMKNRYNEIYTYSLSGGRKKDVWTNV